MRRVRAGLLAVAVCLCLGSQAVRAQDGAEEPAPELATLVADQVSAGQDGVLTATGAVEVFYQGQRLTASEVIYDREKDLLTVTGPLRLTSPDGQVLIAEFAELSPDFREGVLRSARLVLDQQLQIASSEVQRVEGRYSQAVRTVASSCEICEGGAPLWQIRARKVIHDQEEKQIYFENATFEVGGVPVFYWPRLRLPDPTLERATGFLFPTIRTSSDLGTGLKFPYFIRLNDHSDLLLTPYITQENARTIEARYRQAFASGDLRFAGALSRDELEEGTRGYGILRGRFDIPYDFRLGFRLEQVSDANYYRDYGLPERDRINSTLFADRTRRDNFIRGDIDYFESFREDEDNETLPRLITDAEYQYRFDMPGIGGQGEVEFGLLDLNRASPEDIIGRNTTNLSATFDWRDDWYSQQGLVTTAVAQLSADYYRVTKDSTFDPNIFEFTPAAAVQLAWPLSSSRSGRSTIFEPVAQLIWSQPSTEEIPDEDTTSLEFDEASLFDLTRFSDSSRSEGGFQANLGGTWTRFTASGWETGITAARVFLESDNRGVLPGSDVMDPVTDYLTTVRLKSPWGLSLINRAQYSDEFVVNKNALRLGWAQGLSSVSATYTWLRASETDNRPDNTSELLLFGSHAFDRNWSGDLEYRYDFEIGRAREIRANFVYENECARFLLTARNKFSSSSSLRSSQSFGISVELAGFGGNDVNRVRRGTCRR